MKSFDPTSAKTLVELLTYRANIHPDKIAIRYLAHGEDETEVLTYQDLHLRSQAFAASLREVAEPGDRALILLPNDVSFITTFFGCLYAGVVAVPGYPPRANRNQDRIIKMLSHCGAKVIVGDANLNKQQLISHLTAFENLQYLDLSTVELDLTTSWRISGVQGEDLAFLQYTSGSTSDPKGVMLTHRNLLSNQVMISAAFNTHADSRVLSWLPLYHDMGLIGMLMNSLYVGAEVTLMPPTAFIQQPLRWLKAVTRYKATHTGAPNFAFDLCVRRFNAEEWSDLDLSSLGVFFSGAEPVRHETLQAFTSTFTAYGLNQKSYMPCYGLAESSLFVTGGPFQSGETHITVSRKDLSKDIVKMTSMDATTLVSSGHVAQGLDVQIVDLQTLRPISSHQIGEILVSGPSVSQGYWDNAEKNAESFGIKIPGQGDKVYMRTGDLGCLIDQNLYVTGRLKDVIIIGGKNHYPQDIEATVQAKCEIASIAAAFSVEEGGVEQLVLAVEVGRTQLSSDFNQAGLQISRAVGTAHELMTHRIVFLKPGVLPRTSSGKLQRRLTRQKLLDGTLAIAGEWTGSNKTAETPMKVSQTPRKPAGAVAHIKAWLQHYSETRLNISLAHNRKTFPPHLILDAGKQGLFGLLVPKQYGGLGLSHAEFIQVAEQIGAVDLSLSLLVGIHNALGLHPILTYGSEEMKAELLPRLARGQELASFAITEPSAGSNPKAILSKATKGSDGVSLSGEKIWIGLGSWASVITVFCKEYNAQNKPVGISSFLVRADQEGVTFGPEAMTMGAQPVVQVPVYFNNVSLSDTDRLNPAGKGLPVAFSAMNLARYGLSAMALGAMKRCYQLVELYASNRQVNTGLLLENGHVLSALSQMNSAIEVTEKLVTHVSSLLDAGQEVAEELYMLCKITTPELLWDVVDTTMQLHGGRGYIEANFIPQLLRDARLLRIFEGPTETLRYHLGSVIWNSTSDRLFATLEKGAEAQAQLHQDLEKLRTLVDDQASSPVRHIAFCGVGQLAAWAALKGFAQNDQAKKWLELQYQLTLTALHSELASAKTLSKEVAQAKAAEFYSQVGLAKPALAGENWNSMFQASEPVRPYSAPSKPLASTPAEPAAHTFISAVTASTEPTASEPLKPQAVTKKVPQPVFKSGGSQGAMKSETTVKAAAKPQAKPKADAKAQAKPVAQTVQRPSAPPKAAPAKSEAKVQASQDEIKAFMAAKIVELRPVAKAQVEDDVPFTALGIDSLAGAELVMALEKKYGVSLPDTLAWDYPTIAEASLFIEALLQGE